MLDADGMAHWMRNTLRRFGFVSMTLLALLVIMPASQVQAQVDVCAPDRSFASLSVVTSAPDVCPIDGCQDCGLTCADGCCHAPAVAPLAATVTASPYVAYARPAGWTDVLGVPFGQLSGLKRPPRA